MATLNIDDGYVVAVEFGANGGITYDREDISQENEGRGLRAEFKTRKHVDDVELVAESTKIIDRAYGAIARHCTKTPIGYFTPKGSLERLEEEVSVLRTEAEEFNFRAVNEGSARRVRVAIYPMQLVLDDARAASRLAALVRERLRNLASALRAGDRKAFEGEMERCKNLELLAVGVQRDAIVDALGIAKDRKRELLLDLRAGTDPAAAGAKLDVSAIEASENLFV